MPEQIIHTGSSHGRYYTQRDLRKIIVAQARIDFKGHLRKFDTFIVTGFSGAVIGGVLAAIFNKDLLVVRKKETSDHRTMIEEGIYGTRCVFIDDLVASGSTAIRVMNAIDKTKSTLRGIWMSRDAIDTAEDKTGFIYSSGSQSAFNYMERVAVGKTNNCKNFNLRIKGVMI